MRKAASFYPRTAWARRAARQFVAERRIAAGGIHFRRGVKKWGPRGLCPWGGRQDAGVRAGRRVKRPDHRAAGELEMEREHRRGRPGRLPHWDYGSVGCYFLTFCTKDRQCLLSRITEEKGMATSVARDDLGARSVRLTSCGVCLQNDFLLVDKIPLYRLTSALEK